MSLKDVLLPNGRKSPDGGMGKERVKERLWTAARINFFLQQEAAKKEKWTRSHTPREGGRPANRGQRGSNKKRSGLKSNPVAKGGLTKLHEKSEAKKRIRNGSK